jgi:predicted enzyme related to lactoylglutathione lyase
MSKNPVGWFEIYVQDINRAKSFYEAVLNVKLEKLNAKDPMMPEMWTFPMVRDGSGATGALVKMTGVASGGNSVLIYFVCADCATEAGRVAKAGGRIHRDKMPIGEYGFIALAVDTEGNMFGLHSIS